MGDDLTRGTELIEQLLGDPALRRSFREDPASVLQAHGLGALAEGLAPGERAMLTLELRESRSSLAGVIVAAAAEGVDFTHAAEHAAPRLGGDLAHVVSRLLRRFSSHRSHPAPVHHESARLPRPRPPRLAPVSVGPMAKEAHTQAATPAAPPPPAPAAAPPAPAPAAPPAAHHHPDHHAVEMAAGLTAHDPHAYPGDTATPQQIAAWMGANARRVGVPAELPVMAALTESGLRNLGYGDRDSVGFFQMRTSIWDEGPYAGYLADPQKQIEWFLNQALAVRRSDPSLAGDPSRWGEWVADVEQPAAEYRYRYQLELPEAMALLRGAGSLSTSGAAVDAPVHAAGVVRHHVDLGVAVRHSALSHHPRHAQRGPHEHREGRAAGLDARGASAEGAAAAPGGSGAPPPPGAGPALSAAAGAELVRSAYAEHGVQLPVAAAQQFEVGAAVPRADLAPGDAVFFGSAHDAIDGAGIYVGDGRVAVGDGREVSLGAEGLRFLGARRYSERLLTGRESYARTLPTISRHPHHRGS